VGRRNHRPRPIVVALLAMLTLGVAVALLSFRGDSGSSPATTPDATIGPSNYLVRRGDTASSVAKIHVRTRRDLLDQVGLDRTDSLDPGATLEIPPLPTEGETPPPGVAAVPAAAVIEQTLDQAAAEFGVPPSLLESLAWRASKWSAVPVPGSDALGLGRLSPSVVDWTNANVVDEPLDPRVPESGARLLAAYVGALLEITDGDQAATVVAFRQGLTERYDQYWDLGVIRYVRKVLGDVPGFEGQAAPGPPPTTAPTTAPAG
jgi:hypothetical protein